MTEPEDYQTTLSCCRQAGYYTGAEMIQAHINEGVEPVLDAFLEFRGMYPGKFPPQTKPTNPYISDSIVIAFQKRVDQVIDCLGISRETQTARGCSEAFLEGLEKCFKEMAEDD